MATWLCWQELYSSDGHCLLELVQNADDNDYPSGVTPALQFVVAPGTVAVLNNEVRALWLGL